MTKINMFDREEDRDRMARGLDPINHTRAEYEADACGEPSPAEPAVKPPKKRHSCQLSRHAHEDLTQAQGSIAEIRPLSDPPSVSVAVEFLVWWFDQTRFNEFEGKPSPREFNPRTRAGRPAFAIDPRPISPVVAREGLGLAPVVQKRKL